MKAYQIFQAISPELGHTLFQDLRIEHRDAYKGVLVSLAAKRRLRPVFVQRKPAPQQIDWLYKSCQLKPVDDLAENMLQVWLLKSQKALLIKFLDEIGVDHDENGTVEDLPETIDDKKLNKAVDILLKEFPAEHVKLYLHVFQLQRPGGWDNLGQMLESDARLAFRPVAKAAVQASEAPAVEAETPADDSAAEAPAAADEDAAPKKKKSAKKKTAAAE